MSEPGPEDFQERLTRVETQLRSVRRVLLAMLLLIAVAIASVCAYRAAGVVFRPKTRGEIETAYRTA
jgi:hypothetical protein